MNRSADSGNGMGPKEKVKLFGEYRLQWGSKDR